MSIGTPRGLLLFFSALAALAHVSEALARVSGAQGGLKVSKMTHTVHLEVVFKLCPEACYLYKVALK